MCLISSFNLSGFNFQPLVNFIHLCLLRSMWKKNGACQIEKYVKNMGVNNSIHAQHWTENCGGMSACLQHNPLFSLTTSFWSMSILDWNSARSLIKMNLLEQVWAECWQLLLNCGGMIRKKRSPHNCPPPFTTFLDTTWMKCSWRWHAKLERGTALCGTMCTCYYGWGFFLRWRLISCFLCRFWSVPIVTQIKWTIKRLKTYVIINKMWLNVNSDTKSTPHWVF